MRYFLLLSCLALFSATAFHQGPKKIKLPKAYVYIPSGTYAAGGKTVSVQGFYMQAWEVSNLEYNEFLFDLKREGRTEEYEKARVRPEGWATAAVYAGAMAEKYHQHPAFENYPAVNITREAALLYCQWLTKKLLVFNPEARFGVRLPSEVEWAYAAQAGHAGFPYPHGYSLQDAKGQFLYNFRHIGDESIHSNPETGQIEVRPSALVPAGPAAPVGLGPAPSKSNAPNDFGLYNMSGNVAEMITGEPLRTKGGCFNSTGYDIRIDAPDTFAGEAGASPYVGFRPVVTVVGK
ncbi:MAG: SUMF1/EgtB/PvdO family nonheme iron enzyme [Saprospirales bacterium]|nr:SUMF1/EgtB/PvdO family nonheme iron enzyme [Saprospirales bacterium]